MNAATRARWYVEDGIAEARLAALDADAEVIRLDRPRWRDLQRATGPVDGLAVGAGTRGPDLAAALADLAARDEVRLALPDDGLGTLDWIGLCAGWHVTGTPETHGDLLTVRIAPAAPGPTLASLCGLHHRTRATPLHLPAPWRLQLTDAVARAWFGDLTTADARAALSVTGTQTPDQPDVSHPPARLHILARDDAATASSGGRVVVTDDPVRGRDGVRVVARPIDLRRYSPVGCDPRGASGAPVLPVSMDGHPDQLVAARAAAREVAAAAVAAGALSTTGVREVAVPGDGIPSPAHVARVRAAVALLDHPGLHAGPATHARWLLACVASGAPVRLLAPLPDPVAALVGAHVAASLAATSVEDVLDPDLRERTSVRQRRAVLAAHTSSARLRQLADALGLLAPQPRAVSVVLATNRPDFLEHACRQIARQRWPRLEAVVVTHGDAPAAEARRTAGEILTDLPVVHAHVDADRTLGDALNVGVEMASGELITKFDDDDWYSPWHVDDVVAALDYSGADVAGKAAEFVHLAQAGTTLRRWGHGGERYSPTLAGGTLTFSRQLWRDLAGFPRINLGEDRGIVEDVLAADGTTYRAHPYGYLLHRHGRHAWEVDDEVFLADAVATRPGEDHDWTLT